MNKPKKEKRGAKEDLVLKNVKQSLEPILENIKNIKTGEDAFETRYQIFQILENIQNKDSERVLRRLNLYNRLFNEIFKENNYVKERFQDSVLHEKEKRKNIKNEISFKERFDKLRDGMSNKMKYLNAMFMLYFFVISIYFKKNVLDDKKIGFINLQFKYIQKVHLHYINESYPNINKENVRGTIYHILMDKKLFFKKKLPEKDAEILFEYTKIGKNIFQVLNTQSHYFNRLEYHLSRSLSGHQEMNKARGFLYHIEQELKHLEQKESFEEIKKFGKLIYSNEVRCLNKILSYFIEFLIKARQDINILNEAKDLSDKLKNDVTNLSFFSGSGMEYSQYGWINRIFINTFKTSAALSLVSESKNEKWKGGVLDNQIKQWVIDCINILNKDQDNAETFNRIKDLLKQENDKVEWKISIYPFDEKRVEKKSKDKIQKIGETIVAMSNTDGGNILIGKADQEKELPENERGGFKEINGYRFFDFIGHLEENKSNFDNFKIRLLDALGIMTGKETNEFNNILQFEKLEFRDRDSIGIVLISIEKSDSPIFIQEKKSFKYLVRSNGKDEASDLPKLYN